MNPAIPFIPKEDSNLPDAYGLILFFHDGTKEEVEIVKHTTICKIEIPDPNGPFQWPDGRKFKYEPNPAPVLEYLTKDELWNSLPLTSFRRMSLDKRFSKILELKSKQVSQDLVSKLDTPINETLK